MKNVLRDTNTLFKCSLTVTVVRCPFHKGARLKRGMNRGMEIRRSVPFFGPNPSIRRYFRSNPDPRYVKSYCGIRLLQFRVDVWVFFFHLIPLEK